jgi:glycerol-3-phosphate dehydrogenase (NAD(P)+)
MSVDEVIAVSKQTAVGVMSCQSILELAHKQDVGVPIIEQVAAVVHDGRRAEDVVGALMMRALKNETD